LKNLFWINI